MRTRDDSEPKARIVLAEGSVCVLTIEVLSGPESHDYFICRVLIKMDEFTADYTEEFESYHFRQFRRELSGCYRTLKGSAKLESSERRLSVEFTMTETGGVDASGVARSFHPRPDVTLEFEFGLDQTYLPPICRQLKEVLELT